MLKTIFLRGILALAPIMALASCGSVFDDLPPCPEGVRLRFVYDYNLEAANAFPSQVDCLTLHLYSDDGGDFIATYTVTDPALLSDENWRMELDIPSGSYRAVVYGGIACADASFAHSEEPRGGSAPEDIRMSLLPSHIGKRLHDHFHGTAEFEVTAGPEAADVTVHLSKTTNHFRILLLNVDGRSTDGADFDFSITDDNALLDWKNRPVPGNDVRYTAWAQGAEDVTTRAGEGSTVAFAELSTSRLHYSTDPVLLISNHHTGKEIIRLPLKKYLLLSKNAADPWGDQEYLDRCSRWNLTFFLDSDNQWAQTRIIVNGWTVRLNPSDF